MAKRKSAGEDQSAKLPARRSTRNAVVHNAGPSSKRKKNTKNEKPQDAETEEKATATSKSRQTSSSSEVLKDPTLLEFDEAAAIHAQTATSEFFYVLPKALVVSILYTGYFDSLFILRSLRPSCR